MSPPELALLGAGCGLLLQAILWRAIAQQRARRLLRQALVHPEPAVRRAAVRVVGEHGLARHAKALLYATQHEQDPSVLAALAEEVVRNHWEPDDDRRLVKLRLWARLRLEVEPDPAVEAFAPSAADGDGTDESRQEVIRQAPIGQEALGEGGEGPLGQGAIGRDARPSGGERAGDDPAGARSSRRETAAVRRPRTRARSATRRSARRHSARRRSNREAVGREAVGREAVGREAVGREAVGREAVGQEAVGQEAVGQEAISRRLDGVDFAEWLVARAQGQEIWP